MRDRRRSRRDGAESLDRRRSRRDGAESLDRRPGGAATALCLLACALGACLQPRPDCSGRIASLERDAGRRLHVRLLLTHDGDPQRHEVVVSAEPGRIQAIGLTPVGTQAYRLVHDHDGIEVENRIGRYLGLSPRLAYDAIARAYLAPGSARPAPGRLDAERDVCGYQARLVLLSDEPLTEPPTPAS